MNYQTRLSQKHYLIFGGILGIALLADCTLAQAQISADDTVSTEVNRSDNISEITGGTTRGSNLFHSFQEFSVPQGNTAWFNNSNSIGNIISRVTGETVSNIDGLIRANGNANLILINPSGINFGANARLDIGGSFLGSTANDLIFEDGTTFSANNPDAPPLLTVSVPVGLQLGQNSAAINVRGTGHNLSLETTVFSNFTRDNVSGLAVEPGRTVSLIGNGLSFAGGTIAVESGEIKLGSVSQGRVGLNLSDRGWEIDYNNVSLFGDIEFQQKALINVSGDANGQVELDGREILLQDGSVIISDNFGAEEGGKITIAGNSLNISDRAFISSTSFGSGKGGDITLNIAEAIDIRGTGYEQFQQAFQISALNGSLVPGTRGTGIFIGTATDGRSGNLKLDTASLNLREGAIISNPIFTNGIGGDLEIKADDFGVSGSAVQITAGVDSTSSAAAGDIIIDANRLSLRDGGTIVNATFGDAAGGKIDIDATEAISLVNTPDDSLIFTGIYASTSIGTGDSGGIDLTTDSLYIDDSLITSNSGAFIRDGSLGFSGGGNGGDIAIEAAEKIEISGISVDDPRFVNGISSGSYFMGNAGNITISTGKLSIRDGSEIAAITTGSGDGGNLTIDAESIEAIGITINNIDRGGLIAASGRSAFGQQQASGSSGDIEITTGNLAIQNAASVDVQSLGTGDAGNLSIVAEDSILLNNRGTISAAANSGTGGNINLNADTIFWRNRSTTTATASNDANGGNINLEANYLVALEASRLTADADAGQGGNINVNTEGLFVCQECRVSASSQLGVDGIVNFTTLDPNPNLEVVDIPIQLTQPEEAVALACSATNEVRASTLTINGRGGLPPRPTETLNSSSIISFGASAEAETETENKARLPAPARNWYINQQGATILTAQSNVGTPKFNSPDCHVP